MRTIEGKVVVLGAEDVGKSSLVLRYTRKVFCHEVTPTVGATFCTCKLFTDNTQVKLSIWDTAGQERFRSIVPLYYRSACAAILVYDITNYESFLALQDWVAQLRHIIPQPMIISVVGNKTDLEWERKVLKEEALQYARSIDAQCFEVSALNDEGIDKVFHITSLGLIRLAEESPSSNVRVYESPDYPGMTIADESVTDMELSGGDNISKHARRAAVAQRRRRCC